jgi:hypothetical protein
MFGTTLSDAICPIDPREREGRGGREEREERREGGAAASQTG